MKKMLMVATVPSMIGQFNMDNVRLLQELGYEVQVACDFTDVSIWPEVKVKKFKTELQSINVKCVQIDFSRNLGNIKHHWNSYKQFRKLLQQEKYSFIHTHTPVASVIVRMAAKHELVKVIYTAHGFHFFKGSSLKNWILFYPIEKWMSKYTDVLITINLEDYKIAKKKFNAIKTRYIPGVGIDTRKIAVALTNREKKRKELNLKESDKMILSVGELNENKNHGLAIRGLAKYIQNNREESSNVRYFICGQGNLRGYLQELITNLGVANNVYLMGYRNDVAELLKCADVFVSTSKREGLPVSLMEAMASGLPSIVTKVRGNTDLVHDSIEGLVVDYKEDSVAQAIEHLIDRKSVV